MPAKHEFLQFQVKLVVRVTMMDADGWYFIRPLLGTSLQCGLSIGSDVF